VVNRLEATAKNDKQLQKKLTEWKQKVSSVKS
jgi:hypothetical protein